MSLKVGVERGALSISSGSGFVIRAGLAGVETSDGTYWTTAGGEVQATPQGWLLRRAGDDRRPELRWHITQEPAALRLALEVENTTRGTVTLERLDVLVAPDGLAGANFDDLRASQTGWQSWSVATPPLPLRALPHPGHPPIQMPRLSQLGDRDLPFPWMTCLKANEHSLLAGFVSARNQTGLLTIRPTGPGHSLIASCYVEHVPLAPGAMVQSETLMLIPGQSEADSLGHYARTLAAEMHARPWPSVPTGWCSWYHFFTGVTEQDMLRNLSALAERRADWPVEVVQLDDGYQAEIGDWLTLNDKFPSGMRFLTDAIRAQGFKPGIWLAPFLVSERSRVYAEHPDWILRDERGEPLLAIHNWEARQYALDTTHPEVERWLRQVISTLVSDWGYEYLKIDFVYAAALQARRYDPAMTSVQAYRHGLEVIREVTGERFILGCGAPFLPSVGLVDAMRIGADVAPFWRSDRAGSEPSLHDAIRPTLAHTWMHPHLWINDPDCVLLRGSESSLTLPEIQSWISIVALSGGMVLFSDDLTRLEPERAALGALLLPPASRTAAPLGPYVDAMPTRLQSWVDTGGERWLLAAQFNWTDLPQELTFDPADWTGLSSGRYHLFDFWTQEHWGPVTGPVDLGSVPPHGVRSLAVHADRSHPQVVGATLHALNGAAEVEHQTWTDGTLTIELACPGHHRGHLAIYAPPDYQLELEAGPPSPVRSGALWLIPVQLADRRTIRLRFARPTTPPATTQTPAGR